jgi:hypothetical protein
MHHCSSPLQQVAYEDDFTNCNLTIYYVILGNLQQRILAEDELVTNKTHDVQTVHMPADSALDVSWITVGEHSSSAESELLRCLPRRDVVVLHGPNQRPARMDA